jgi:hypothetical protein
MSLSFVVTIASMLLIAALIGCKGRTEVFPNRDPDLRRTPAQFAADAARRFPYKADAPRGGEAQARAQVAYWLDMIEIVNLSEETWADVEIWVNGTWVCHVPTMAPNDLKRINFRMLFDENGSSFPIDNRNTLVKKIEIYRDGKMYDVRTQQAD